MATVAWTLEYAGDRRPLSAWGIRSPQLTFRSLDVDEFTFFIPRTDVLAAAIFPYGADLILRRDEVGWFRGKVMRPAASGNSRTEGDQYVVTNAWGSLARLVYQQQWCIAGSLEYTPRITLGQNVWGQKISIGRQISEIITYALTKGVSLAAGSLPEFTECWLEESRDLTCAGAIRNVLRLLPNAVGWCDYSAAGTPVLNIQENTALSAVELDATAGESLADFSNLGPRNDLVPPGVTFIYTGTNRHAESGGGDGRTYTTITRDSAGTADVEGSIVALVELNEGETAPTAAALAYWTALQVVQWQGSVRMKEQECTGLLRPGKVLNIANGRTAWASMRAVIQSVTENLYSGETTADLGPPEHLAPQDFIEQQQVARRRPTQTLFPVTQACSVADPAHPELAGDPETGTAPTSPITNTNAGIDPKMLAAENADKRLPVTSSYLDSLSGDPLTLTACEDGETVTVKLKGVRG